MILDTSVVVALALHEPEQDRFLRAMSAAPVRRISAGTWIELSAVSVRGKLFGPEWLDGIRNRYAIVIEPMTIEQAQIGHLAYRTYGIGTGHKARLNFGDCFSYALAKATGERLLFKGDDFTHTDVLRALDA